jgi:DNA excision repair protein ERCC-4
MKIIENIFQKKELKNIKEKEKKLIKIDHREKNSFVIAELRNLNAILNIEHLKTGDYIIGDLIIERKTYNDFLNSIINKRIIKQIESLKQFQNKLLIIEGHEEEIKQRLFHKKAIRGFTLSIILKHKIPLYFTKNSKETAELLLHLSEKKENKNNSLRENKKTKNKKEQQQYILEGFPGIGSSTAKKLLKKFKTLNNIFNAYQEELKNEIGKKAEIFNILKQDY